jgi:hypothetical protein
MKVSTRRSIHGRAGALCIASLLALSSMAAVQAAEPVTAQSLIDRQMILDQITRYYYNFGKSDRQSEESFYAEDGVLILGTRRFEGREGIKSAYTRPAPAPAAGSAPAPAAGAAPAPAAAAAPARERTAFNVTIDNPLIIVHGNTATSQVIFTEYRQDKAGDPMKMTTQGKEYATWVKVNGQWLYKQRQIAGGSEPPAGWKE